MENIFIIVVTVLAAYYLWRRFFSKKNKGGCASGCPGCGGDCGDEKEKMSGIYGLKEKEPESPSKREPSEMEK